MAQKKRNGAWKPSSKQVFDIYEAYRNGQNDAQVAAAMEIPFPIFKKALADHPATHRAKQWGRYNFKKAEEGKANAFDQIVLGQMPVELREKWDEFRKEATTPREGAHKAIAVMDKRERQVTFFHVWMKMNFNISRTLQYLNIPHKTYEKWCTDTKFKELKDAMKEAKRDVVEDSLLRLVRRQNPAATIFAAKTLLKERGYGEETKVTGKIEHDHKHDHHLTLSNINLMDLDLPLDVQMQVMDAMEKKKIEIEEMNNNPKLIEVKS